MNESELKTMGRNQDMFERLCLTLSQPDIDKSVIEASVLQLAGGAGEPNDFGADTRGSIHIAIVSGSSANLSRLISAIADLAPRSTHLNGTSTTLAGAIGTVKGGELVPGPLLDDSVEFTFIEQLDATDKDTRGALQQIFDANSYSFAKSNYRETVPASGSVMIAVNPRYGVWDQYEAIGDQLNLGPEVSHSVDLVTTNLTAQATSFKKTVSRRVEPLSPELARDYLQLARSKQPSLSSEAESTIADFIERIERYVSEGEYQTMGSARLKESLTRFTEAHARLRLSESASQGDAKRVISLFEATLESRGIGPETETFDADVVESGVSKSDRDRIKNIKQLIAEIEEEYTRGAPIEVVLDRADEIGMDPSKAEHEIDKLKQNGEAYEPSTNHLRVN